MLFAFIGSLRRRSRDDETTAVVVLSVPTDRQRGVRGGSARHLERNRTPHLPLLPTVRQGLLHLPTTQWKGQWTNLTTMSVTQYNIMYDHTLYFEA